MDSLEALHFLDSNEAPVQANSEPIAACQIRGVYKLITNGYVQTR